jgi:hypothetical protein
MNKKIAKKFSLIGVVVIAMVVLLVIIFSKNPEKIKSTGDVIFDNKMLDETKLDDKLKLGYCPSMSEEAIKIDELNDNIQLVPKSNTAEVLNSLNNGDIDIALVGRIAAQSEVYNATEKRLDEGYTLVTSVKKFIQKNEISSLRVHTYLDRVIADELLTGADIIYYSDFKRAIGEGLNDVVLIDWDDYSENMNLLVVMDGELKAREFRIPILYSIYYDLNLLKV